MTDQEFIDKIKEVQNKDGGWTEFVKAIHPELSDEEVAKKKKVYEVRYSKLKKDLLKSCLADNMGTEEEILQKVNIVLPPFKVHRKDNAILNYLREQCSQLVF